MSLSVEYVTDMKRIHTTGEVSVFSLFMLCLHWLLVLSVAAELLWLTSVCVFTQAVFLHLLPARSGYMEFDFDNHR